MIPDAPTPDDLRRQARLKREAARIALAEDDAIAASDLHLAAIALENAAKEMERARAK